MPKPRPLPRVEDHCRRWMDGNGHIFRIENIAPDPEPSFDGQVRVIFEGTSSNCTCQKRFLQHYSHDGPMTIHGTIEDFEQGFLFGWEPDPDTIRDVARFVDALLSLDPVRLPQFWEIADDEYRDFDDFADGYKVPFAAISAFNALCSPDRGGPTNSVVRHMLDAGHRDTHLIATVILAGATPDEAKTIPLGLPAAEREETIAAYEVLAALR